MGANIPGKPHVFTPYIGGVDAYRLKCEEIAQIIRCEPGTVRVRIHRALLPL